MNWRNVRLIFQREVRDQLRDRRTLFTIAVLPLVLYPLLGMSFLQMTQFMREHPTKVRVIGTKSLPADPPLVDNNRFLSAWCPEPEAKLLNMRFDESLPPQASMAALTKLAQRDIQVGLYDAMVYFPPNFAEELDRFRREVRRRQALGNSNAPSDAPAPPEPDANAAPPEKPVRVPEPMVFTNTANDKSRIASQRVERVLRRWREAVVQQTLRQNNIPMIATDPFQVLDMDVAEDRSKRAAVWSKVLPFVVLVWALTGAFYPAIDLCAGEKERGTLETLLSSPALRGEIVWGKLLTTMVFSISTALLNVVSMTITATLFVRQLEQGIGAGGGTPNFGAPPIGALGWLLLALVPISALFSALSLAVASFARSSKEGQYYLMPLLLVTLPLMILPLLPIAELNLGTSLIPVTGAMLLLRTLIEGRYAEALIFLPPVAAVTAGCCLLSIRWAVDQFNNESVLFRESERWDVRLLVKRAMRDRGDLPTVGQAVLCGVLLLLIRFFTLLTVGGVPSNWNQFFSSTLIGLIALIAAPAVIMAVMLTRRPALTLLLRRPIAWWTAPAAVALAFVLHPAGMALAELIGQLYPISGDVKAELGKLDRVISQAPGIGAILILMAIAPAICEELAFRGFILSGLRRSGHKWAAIVISSALFGSVHSILQQSLAAFVLGIVIGYVALQTRSLLTAVLFHVTHNGLSLIISMKVPELRESNSVIGLLFRGDSEHVAYHPAMVVVGLGLGGALLYAISRLPYVQLEEERLRAVLDDNSSQQRAPEAGP